jgi:WhiB family transcriptional regulator, redox-sensing transcriptional regulator
MNVSWPDDAACREPGIDPELFFPFSEAGPGARQVAAAKAVCARCPVAVSCRDWALRTGEPAGIWGGTTPGERRLLRPSRYDTAARRPDSGLASDHPGAIAS